MGRTRSWPAGSVALIGMDGSGKSTLAAAIARALPCPARVVYMGLWQKERKPAWLGLPGADLAALLLFAWRAYLTGLAHRVRGRCVIFDRYVFDALLGFDEVHGLKTRLYLSILGHGCPPPDVTILLDTPGEIAFARKGEHDPARLNEDRTRFLSLVGRVPRLAVVDADRDLAIVEADVFLQVAALCSRRQAR